MVMDIFPLLEKGVVMVIDTSPLPSSGKGCGRHGHHRQGQGDLPELLAFKKHLLGALHISSFWKR